MVGCGENGSIGAEASRLNPLRMGTTMLRISILFSLTVIIHDPSPSLWIQQFHYESRMDIGKGCGGFFNWVQTKNSTEF